MTDTQHPAPTEPAYAAPAPAAPAPVGRTNGLGIAALVVGIVALVLGLIPFVSYFGAFLAFVGLVLGVIGLVLKGRKKGIAIAGTIVSGIALILAIVLSVVYTTAIVSSVNKAIEEGAPGVQGPAVDVPADEEPATDGAAGEQTSENVLVLGQTMVWNDGIEMTVSAPVEFTPSETSYGYEPGQIAVLFQVTITNNSAEQLEPLSFSLVSSGGADAAYIIDTAQGIEGAPANTILPGESITWQEAYAVLDPADIAFQSSPGLLYDEAIWTSQ
ncbi:DUF4190 domain-containing protein [Naasia sp. SYSU D00948]|uniref:DUF4190 domain-containing protein n=1 Tax=Naasia sp. SYSU D00948 TaxID=2817379 RepID=UPI001B313DEA|nr:DUF4190 domain-containing protein [Naasia sp. SYSU D00948]